MYEMKFYSDDIDETVYIYADSSLALKENHSILVYGGCAGFIMWLMYVTCIRKGRDTGLVGDDLYELRLFFGPGYRIYYTEENNKIILLINGGDKSKQSKDIEKAHELLDQWRIKND